MSVSEFVRLYQELSAKNNIHTPQIAEENSKSLKRALLIGINYFGQDSELSGCQNDIANMKTYLRKCGYREFVVLQDSKNDPQFLNPAAPTRKNILEAMRKFIQTATPGMELYIHYSGHGSHLTDQNGDEVDGEDECICPVDTDFNSKDYGFIRDDELNEILVKGLPEGVKLRVCFDSCHSGSALDLPFRWVPGGVAVENDNKDCADKDIIFISGCMDPQTSADSSFNGRSAGAMTWALLESLYDIQKSGKYSNSWSWPDLVQNMRIKLRIGQYDQIPQLGLTSSKGADSFVDLI